MPIKSHVGPAGGTTTLQRALSARRPHAAVTPLGGPPQAGAPIPVYHLGVADLANDAPLHRAAHTGWRYPVIGALEPGLADVREALPGQGATFGGLQQGLIARRLLQASLLAETALAGAADNYEPRLLEMPALRFSALWLHAGADNRFVPLLEGRPPGTAPLALLGDVITDLRVRAAARPRRHPASPGAALPAGGRTPTN